MAAKTYTDWLSSKKTPIRDWEYGYINIPATTVATGHGGTPGASFIATQWNYVAGREFQLLDLPVLTSLERVGLCIRENRNGTIRRYKLTDDTWFSSIAPMYNGEIIGSNFVIELWTDKDVPSGASLYELKKLRTSIRRHASDFNTVTDYEVDTGEQHSNQDEEGTRASLPDSANVVSRWFDNPDVYVPGSINTVDDTVGSNDMKGHLDANPLGTIVVNSDILRGRQFVKLDGSSDLMAINGGSSAPSSPSLATSGYLFAAAIHLVESEVSSGEYIIEYTNGAGNDSYMRLNKSGSQWQIIFSQNTADIQTVNIDLPFTDVIGISDKGAIIGDTIISNTVASGVAATTVVLGADASFASRVQCTVAEAIVYASQADTTNFASVKEYLRQNALGWIPLSFEFDSDLKFNENS